MTFWHIDNSNRCGCVIWTSGKARAKISQYCGVCNFHHALISSRYRSIWFFWSMYRFILSFHWAYFIHLSIAKSVVWTIGIETLFLYFRYFPSILFLFSDKEGSLWKHERSYFHKDPGKYAKWAGLCNNHAKHILYFSWKGKIIKSTD